MNSLLTILSKHSGRSGGRVTVRHQGGRHKRFLRKIDFERDKKDIWGRVVRVEYDPNRSARIALIYYEDGEKRYILAPLGLKEGQKIIASDSAPIEAGNALPLYKMPVGTQIHNIELRPGKGAQMVKAAGTYATVQSKEKDFVLVKLPSGEIRKIPGKSFATIGQVSNIDWMYVRIGKAGRNRHMGIRPSVRGKAMNPIDHPHGGGEGHNPIGLKYPKTPWGKHALGVKTRNKKKASSKFIMQRRK